MKLVKPASDAHSTPRGIFGGSEISQATTGATNIFMGRFQVPAGAQSRPHYHENCESALYMLSGSIEIRWGDHLEDTL
ncbi:MAG: cupin, partial [Solirubrobacteraceae bacterium]